MLRVLSLLLAVECVCGQGWRTGTYTDSMTTVTYISAEPPLQSAFRSYSVEIEAALALGTYLPQITTLNAAQATSLNTKLHIIYVNEYLKLQSSANYQSFGSEIQSFLSSSAKVHPPSSTNVDPALQLATRSSAIMTGLWPYQTAAAGSAEAVYSTLSMDQKVLSDAKAFNEFLKTNGATFVLDQASALSSIFSTTFAGPTWLAEASAVVGSTSSSAASNAMSTGSSTASASNSSSVSATQTAPSQTPSNRADSTNFRRLFITASSLSALVGLILVL